MKNCTQCPNLNQKGKNCKCSFYNRVLNNVDIIPNFCSLYKNTTVFYPSLDRALNYLNFALLTTQEPAPDIKTIQEAIINAIADIKIINLCLR